MDLRDVGLEVCERAASGELSLESRVLEQLPEAGGKIVCAILSSWSVFQLWGNLRVRWSSELVLSGFSAESSDCLRPVVSLRRVCVMFIKRLMVLLRLLSVTFWVIL